MIPRAREYGGERAQRKILMEERIIHKEHTGEGEERGQWGEPNAENRYRVTKGRQITWGEGIRMGEDVEAEGEKRLRK